jgi:GAF domain-containing protein
MTTHSEPGADVDVREQQVVKALVALADTLVADYDVTDFMHVLATRSVELLPVDAAGLLLSDQRGQLQVVAASDHRADLLDLLEAQRRDGPCWDSFTTGHPIVVEDTESAAERDAPIAEEPWPRFTNRRRELGYKSVYAIPLRLRDEVIGALNLLRGSTGGLVERELLLARGLADIATIGLLQERAVREQHVIARQLQTALTTRMVIEQAKGVLAERTGRSMDSSFNSMRTYASAHRQHLGDVAQAVVDNRIPASDIIRLPRDG